MTQRLKVLSITMLIAAICNIESAFVITLRETIQVEFRKSDDPSRPNFIKFYLKNIVNSFLKILITKDTIVQLLFTVVQVLIVSKFKRQCASIVCFHLTVAAASFSLLPIRSISRTTSENRVPQFIYRINLISKHFPFSLFSFESHFSLGNICIKKLNIGIHTLTAEKS